MSAGARNGSMDASERRKAWIGATRRRNELINIAKHRAAHGGRLDHGQFVFVMAQALASAPDGKYRVKHRFVTWHGLDRMSLARAYYEAGLGQIGCDDDLILRALAFVRSTTAMGSDEAGRRMALTAEERDFLSIRTMEAIDECRSDREARRREEKRVRDAERKRRDREGKHAPRAASLSAQKPWIELGICRRTYERRKLSVASLSAETYTGQQTPVDVASLSVSQVCPLTHIRSIYRGCADKLATEVIDPASTAHPQRSEPSICPSDGAGGATRPKGLFDQIVEAPSETILPSPSPSTVLQGADRDAQLHRDVELVLGGGDIELGRQLANALGRSQIVALKDLLPEVGRRAWADALARAATRARRLLKSKSNGGANHVVA